MAVDVKRGADLSVAEPLADRQNVDALGNQKAGLRVPLWHNKDKSENPVFATG